MVVNDSDDTNLGFCADFVKRRAESGRRGCELPQTRRRAGCAGARLKKVSGPDWTDGLSPDIPKSLGATVGTGLGPTDGLNPTCFESDDAKRHSPRRVQTGAYHRPSVLNCVPLAITSFLKVPHERLSQIYSGGKPLSTHLPAESATAPSDIPPWRAVFMGTPHFALPVLDALAENPAAAVVAAYTPPDRRRGRGQVFEATPVKRRAQELGIPVEQPATLRNADAIARLASYAPDVIVVAAYGRLLPPEALAAAPFGCLNLHPSLLPKYRGPSPVTGTILAGDDVTGVTVMLLDEGMDTGPIIAQRERRIEPADDAATLTEALFSDGANLLVETLPKWMGGSVLEVAQDDSIATYTSKLERSDGIADWSLSAETLARRQRAYTPWPGLHTRWDGKELKLLKVEPWNGFDVRGPGQVVSYEDAPSPICISAGDEVGKGLLAVHTLQLEGRRPSDARDFLRGYPQFIGARLR